MYKMNEMIISFLDKVTLPILVLMLIGMIILLIYVLVCNIKSKINDIREGKIKEEERPNWNKLTENQKKRFSNHIEYKLDVKRVDKVIMADIYEEALKIYSFEYTREIDPEECKTCGWRLICRYAYSGKCPRKEGE